MTNADLRQTLDEATGGDRSHVEVLATVAAVVSTALHERGMTATLVGGAAIEYHAADVYTTSDIDLVVEGRSRADIDEVLTSLGFSRSGRHWVRGDVYVEVPGNYTSDPVDVVRVGPMSFRVVKREVVLADRIVGFKHWRATAYGAQAIALLTLFRGQLDERLLRERVRAEDAEDALDALVSLAASGSAGESELERVLESLRTSGRHPRRPE